MLKRLYLTKIYEGGIDLIDGKELPMGIVVSNGIREVTIPVGEMAIKSISLLLQDEDEGDLLAPGSNDPDITSGQEASPGSIFEGEEDPSGAGPEYDDILTGAQSI